MRNTLLLVGLLLACRLFAQDSSKFVIFINPYFTNDKNNNVYEITNKNTSGNGRIEERMKPSYYNASIDVKCYLVLPHRFLAIFQVGMGRDKYYSKLPYKIYLGSDNWENREQTEEINGQSFNLQYGIGKQFSLDKKRKLHFIVEGLFHLNSSSFDKELSDNKVGQVNPSNIDYSGSNLSYGIKCNFAINYQMYKRLGIGLALNNVFNAYELKTLRREMFYIDETETIVKIAQLSSPVFSLVFFL